jgi:predicted enzyme related to lactoylglutathione lyase
LRVAGFGGRFVWYELMTTDMAAAATFYADVVGWNVRDGVGADFVYKLFCSDATPISGLIDLPAEARRMGATARWMGYVSVQDIGATTERLKRLGGTIYVPPTDSNIGRIAVVADPQSATLAFVEGLPTGQQKPAESNRPGRVGWHELLAADHAKAFAFYSELFDWQRAGDADSGSATSYQAVRAGEDAIAGMFNKRPMDPVPFWLFYFNVADIDAAAARVRAGGGQVFEGPIELSDGGWIARCRDPQGAAFSLQGRRGDQSKRGATSEVGWSTEWGGISSRGRLVVTKSESKPEKKPGKKPGSDS